jgi:anti-sigma factor RsiW
MITSHPDGVTLNEYVDDGLAAAARAEVREHLASCAECQAVVDGLRAVQSAASRLPLLQPRREAWPRIERSLRVAAPARRPMPWTWLALAASLLVAVVLGFNIASRRSQPASGVADTETAATAQAIEAELRQAEEHYQKAISGLEQIKNAGKGSLDPQTAATLEKNLSVVDQAISESRAALKLQPTSEPAQASLLDGFKAKIALLQDTVALINEMRQRPALTQKGS